MGYDTQRLFAAKSCRLRTWHQEFLSRSGIRDDGSDESDDPKLLKLIHIMIDIYIYHIYHMYIYMYIYISYMYIYICIYIIYVYIYICIYIIYVYNCIYDYVCMILYDYVCMFWIVLVILAILVQCLMMQDMKTWKLTSQRLKLPRQLLLPELVCGRFCIAGWDWS